MNDRIYVEQTCRRVMIDEQKEQGKTELHYDTVKSIASHRVIPMNKIVKKLLKNLKMKSKSRFVFSYRRKRMRAKSVNLSFPPNSSNCQVGQHSFPSIAAHVCDTMLGGEYRCGFCKCITRSFVDEDDFGCLLRFYARGTSPCRSRD